MRHPFRQQPTAQATTSQTANQATEAATRAATASVRGIEIVTGIVAATESDVIAIAAAIVIAAAVALQMPRGHHVAMLAAIGAAGAGARAGTVTIDLHAAIETETITAAAAMDGRALDPRAAVSTVLASAMIDEIIGNVERGEKTIATAVAAGLLARTRTPATLLRRSSPRTRGTAEPYSSSSLPQG